MVYDLVIQNGPVIDGSGLPRFRADVGASRGRIAAVGRTRAPGQFLRGPLARTAQSCIGVTTPLDDAAPFHLRSGAAAATDRLRRLADLGFDDTILVPSSWSATNLAALRALSPS
jgi:hypothetical protein